MREGIEAIQLKRNKIIAVKEEGREWLFLNGMGKELKEEYILGMKDTGWEESIILERPKRK